MINSYYFNYLNMLNKKYRIIYKYGHTNPHLFILILIFFYFGLIFKNILINYNKKVLIQYPFSHGIIHLF